MSKKVLLSIRPEFAQKIISGEKRFEFRKRCFNPDDVNAVLIYATMPVGTILGEFTIKRIIRGRPDSVWRKTRQSAGISRSYYQKYFDGRDEAFAIEIDAITRFENPVDPRQNGRSFYPPQSYCFWTNR